MRDFAILFVHLIVTLARPGGLRSVVAESVLLRHQLLEDGARHERSALHVRGVTRLRPVFGRNFCGPQPWNKLGSPAIEGGEPSFSPDGKWLAFESKATGRSEIDLVDFPSARRRYRVSRQGGSLPRWRGDGRELYFIGGNAMMAASIAPSGEPSALPPEKRFEVIFRRGIAGRIYDVSRDGSRFLISEETNTISQSNIELILNWPGLLARHE